MAPIAPAKVNVLSDKLSKFIILKLPATNMPKKIPLNIIMARIKNYLLFNPSFTVTILSF